MVLQVCIVCFGCTCVSVVHCGGDCIVNYYCCRLFQCGVVVNVIDRYLDDHELWTSRDFAVHCFKLIVNNVQVI